MLFFRKPISPALSPNVTAKDLWEVINNLLNPARWRQWYEGNALRQLQRIFRSQWNVTHVIAVDSGRTALFAILQSLRITSGDEVVLQAFTCVVVPNTICALGARPRYVDIDATYNINPKELQRVLETTPRVRAVIVQHTFGQPAAIEEIVRLCHEHGVVVIEDCAHALGARVNGKLLGTFGDAAMFSFGRDKVLSTVSGGIALTRRADVGKNLAAFAAALPFPPRWWILQRLLHPLLFACAKRCYYFFDLGKIIIALGRRAHLFPAVVTREEKEGCVLPPAYQYPNVLARWALVQWGQQEQFALARHKIVSCYLRVFSDTQGWTLPFLGKQKNADPVFLRFPVLLPRASELITHGKRDGILFGDWYREIIMPRASAERLSYQSGSCPVAEHAAKNVVNFPLSPTMRPQELKRVIHFVKNFYDL